MALLSGSISMTILSSLPEVADARVQGWKVSAAAVAALGLFMATATAATVDATWASANDVPVTANGYTAAGNTVNFTLNFAPSPGRDLVVINNTGLSFIGGAFDNLAQGQPVVLSYGGAFFDYVADYYGGTGNDLVLVWAGRGPFGWGFDLDGQLGDNAFFTNQLAPAAVITNSVLGGKSVVAMAAGLLHSLALCTDGTVSSCGNDTYCQLAHIGDPQSCGTGSFELGAVNTSASQSALYGKTVVGIAAGKYHSLALCSDGTVAGWGDNTYGQLGIILVPSAHSPHTVNTNAGQSALAGKTVVAIAAGYNHSLALCSDGSVAAWGDNMDGDLGNGNTTQQNAPVAVNTSSGVSALSGKAVVAIAAGTYHSLALCSDGMVAAWGDNSYGQLGSNDRTSHHTPCGVTTNSGLSALYGKTVVAIAAGDTHSLALCSDGTVAAWGSDAYGQLGDGTNTPSPTLVPKAVNTAPGSALCGRRVVAIAAGVAHSLALCSDGSLAAWGLNYYGQLGDGTTNNRSLPVSVSIPAMGASQRFTRVFSGCDAEHTLALLTAAPSPIEVRLIGPQTPPSGLLQFAFTNTPGAFFTVLGATNPLLPGSNWTTLGDPAEGPPGQYAFTGPYVTNSPQLFYRVRSP